MRVQVVPVKHDFEDIGEDMDIPLSPHSLTSIDIPINSNDILLETDSSARVSSY